MALPLLPIIGGGLAILAALGNAGRPRRNNQNQTPGPAFDPASVGLGGLGSQNPTATAIPLDNPEMPGAHDLGSTRIGEAASSGSGASTDLMPVDIGDTSGGNFNGGLSEEAMRADEEAERRRREQARRDRERNDHVQATAAGERALIRQGRRNEETIMDFYRNYQGV